MRSSTLIALAPLAITMVSAGCYKSGKNAVLGDKATANNSLPAICGEIQGYYAAQQVRAQCGGVQTESTYWYFEVQQTGWGDTLSYNECISGLSARFCDKGEGGTNEAGGWYFRADPGNGHCTDIGYINQNPIGKRDEPAPGEPTVYTGEFHPSHEILQAISASKQNTTEAAKGKVEAPFQA